MQTNTLGQLQFVVQKHQASRLHFDFRLEMGGVLKSWAVPKGPSMDPQIKRLAIQVEDHPYAYKNFEGKIAKGNYGAGVVEIWDKGTYTSTKNGDERELLCDLKRGAIHIILSGEKLQGEFALIRTRLSNRQGERKRWLLVKAQDEFAEKSVEL